MRSPLICGTSHFLYEEKEEYGVEELLSPCKVPKKPSKKIKNTENPFSHSGLNKFNALLDELERKKQQIYTQKGSQDISFIRFAYSSSGEWKPIVVKSKTRIRPDDNEHKVEDIVVKHVDHHHHEKAVNQEKVVIQGLPNKESGSTKKIVKLERLSQPYCYVVVMFILIMLLLTIFGRTFTILCTSFGWYFVPLFIQSSSSRLKLSMDRAKMKKVYSVITKESASSSPRSVLSGPLDKSPTPKLAHCKSW